MEPQQIQVQSTPEVIKGTYSNQRHIHFTPEDIRLDFFAIYPIQNSPAQGTHVARIVLTPPQALRLSQTLAQAIQMMSKETGRKIEPSQPDEDQKIGFHTKE